MRVYAKSLLVGLCAAAVIYVVGWRVGLVMITAHTPAAFHRAQDPSSDCFTVETSEDLVAVTVTKERSYVGAVAFVALTMASGWQLRRSWRDRR